MLRGFVQSIGRIPFRCGAWPLRRLYWSHFRGSVFESDVCVQNGAGCIGRCRIGAIWASRRPKAKIR